MARNVEELERIVAKLNKDVLAWQRWSQEFKNWVINELNQIKAGRPNGTNPLEPVTVKVSSQPDLDEVRMEAMNRRMRSMARDLDIIAAESIFGK